MRAINPNGRIITNKKAAMLIANAVKEEIGIELSAEEKTAELALSKTLSE